MTLSASDQNVLAQQNIVIIGGSHAGIACAERLRKLVMKVKCRIDRLSGLPLERPPLSKAFLKADATEDESFCLRPDNWFDDNTITFMDGYDVTAIAPDDHQLTLSDGQVLDWDKWFLPLVHILGLYLLTVLTVTGCWYYATLTMPDSCVINYIRQKRLALLVAAISGWKSRQAPALWVKRCLSLRRKPFAGTGSKPYGIILF